MAAPIPRVPPVTTATRLAIVSLPRSFGFPVNGGTGQTDAAFSDKFCVSIARDAERDAHPAADAQSRQPLLGVTLLHLVEQRHQDTRSRSADRVAEGDGAAIDVDLGGVPAEILVDRASLGRKGLV